MRKGRLLALSLALLICTAALGCGQRPPVASDTPASSTTETGTKSPPPKVVTPTLPTETPPLMQRLVAGDWRFDPDALALPPEESCYTDTGGECETFNEHAYSSGTLRIRTARDDRTVIAVCVDTTRTDYASFAGLVSTEDYRAYGFGDLLIVCHLAPVDKETFDTLKARSFSEDELTAQLGPPSFPWYAHATGYRGLTYLPQGLAFFSGNDWWLLDPTQDDFAAGTGLQYDTDYPQMCEDMLSGHAEGFADHVNGATQALASGKPSPDGRLTAAVLDGGVYWDQLMLIRIAGTAERRFPIGYFASDYFWLDNETIIYGPGISHDAVRVLNVITGDDYEVGRAEDGIDRFGLIDSDHVWYETWKGVKGEMQIRRK